MFDSQLQPHLESQIFWTDGLDRYLDLFIIVSSPRLNWKPVLPCQENCLWGFCSRMTSTMFIILVSLRTAALRPSVVQHQIVDYGPHLQTLLSAWIGVMPQKSPSIQQSIRLITEIENLIRDSL